jgi:hypothetical protein
VRLSQTEGQLVMLTALVLICSTAITADLRDCTRDNAAAVRASPRLGSVDGTRRSETSEPGGKRTGQKVSHYILADGPFARAFAARQFDDFCFDRVKAQEGGYARLDGMTGSKAGAINYCFERNTHRRRQHEAHRRS